MEWHRADLGHRGRWRRHHASLHARRVEVDERDVRDVQFLLGRAEWVGTEFTFALKEENGQVNLRFTQAKWKNVTDSLAFCSTKWATYFMELQELLDSGTSRPYPHVLRT